MRGYFWVCIGMSKMLGAQAADREVSPCVLLALVWARRVILHSLRAFCCVHLPCKVLVSISNSELTAAAAAVAAAAAAAAAVAVAASAALRRAGLGSGGACAASAVGA